MSTDVDMTFNERRFAAQGQYAESILQTSLGDMEASIKALEGVLEIDTAGDFLIQAGYYADGLELYRAAAMRFPDHAALHQGVGCCAGHEGRHDEAIAASKAALALDPENQKYVNDLGWSLFEADLLVEARQVLKRAVAMDPSDDLARENLRYCNEALADGT